MAGYCFLILAVTILIRKPFDGIHFQPELFWSWKQWGKQREQIVTNIIMFIPIGILTGWLWRWRGLIFAAGLSVGIEVFQLITSRGLCEFDDVLHNTIGAVIGLALIMAVKRGYSVWKTTHKG